MVRDNLYFQSNRIKAQNKLLKEKVSMLENKVKTLETVWRPIDYAYALSVIVFGIYYII